MAKDIKTNIMSQEEKNILIKELCMRIPYGVKCNINGELCKVTRVDVECQQVYLKKDDEHGGTYSIARGDVVKPYLRPLTSMTEKEYETFPIPFSFDSFSTWNNTILSKVVEGTQILIGIDEITEIIDWLNAHHFDYRNLIEKGLALVAPEDMYQDIVL